VSDFVVMAFPSEAKAEEARTKLFDMEVEHLIELGHAVIAVKQPDGRVKLNHLFHPAGGGAAFGALWGLLIGFIFMMPLAGQRSAPQAVRSAARSSMPGSTTGS
jgi:uncharacterized membrane protein